MAEKPGFWSNLFSKFGRERAEKNMQDLDKIRGSQDEDATLIEKVCPFTKEK